LGQWRKSPTSDDIQLIEAHELYMYEHWHQLELELELEACDNGIASDDCQNFGSTREFKRWDRVKVAGMLCFLCLSFT
jgi:hypothetical protein